MDNDFRKQWDSTVLMHEQLQMDETSGVEVGRTLKKFPLLTPREYVLSWRLWEGKDKTFYCFTKVLILMLFPPQHSLTNMHTTRNMCLLTQFMLF